MARNWLKVPSLTIILVFLPISASAGNKGLKFAAAALASSTVFDVETTWKSLRSCSNCVEGNPIVRPFTDGRIKFYTFEGSVGAGIWYLSSALHKSKNQRVRKYWWVPSAIVVGSHVAAGCINLRRTSAVRR